MNTYEETLRKLRVEEAAKTPNKEQEMLRLIQAKAEKVANDYLVKHEHTQLSYLPKGEQELHIAIPKGIIIDKILLYLKKI